MPTIDFNDFWTQALAAVLAAVVMLFIRPQWMRRPDKPKPTVEDQPTGNQNNGGNQAVLTKTKVTGDLNLDQSYTDKSQQVTIINNLNSVGTPASSDDDWGRIVLLLVVAVAAACLFVVALPIFIAVSIAVMAVIVLMAITAARRTQRMLERWPSKAVAAVSLCGFACVTWALTWWLSLSMEREELSLRSIAESIPKISDEAGAPGLPNYLEYVVSEVFPAFFGNGEFTLIFVLLLVLGAFSASMLTVLAWRQVREWLSYLSFSRSAQQSKRTTAEAKAFQNGGLNATIIAALVTCALAIFCSSGIPYDLLRQLMA